MKSILLSILCATSLAVPKTEDFRKVCNAHTKHIIEIPYVLNHGPDAEVVSSDDFFALRSCKNGTRAKLFISAPTVSNQGARLSSNDRSKGKAVVAVDIKDKYLPKYDGINFDINDFKTERSLETLLRGWKEIKALSLTMDGEQWPIFSELINRRHFEFASLYFRFYNLEDSLTKLNDKTFLTKPKPPVYFTFADSATNLTNSGIQKANPWVKGITHKQYFYNNFLVVADDSNN